MDREESIWSVSRVLVLVIPFGAALLFVAAYYIAVAAGAAMNSAAVVSGFLRYLLGGITSFVPFSMYEFLIVLLGAFALYSLAAGTVSIVRSKGRRIFTAFSRFLPLVTAAVFIWAAFLWLWCSLYYTAPFYEGVLTNSTPSEDELAFALEYFVEGANEYAPQVSRDNGGHITESAGTLLSRAAEVIPYDKFCAYFPRLVNYPSPRPKGMIFSEFMSATHFTGVYFALTGEANVNRGTPKCFLPSTAAHELAHAHGIAPEAEANFAGIIAASLSGDAAFRYSGFLLGVTELGNALYSANPDRYVELSQNFSELVRIDFGDNHEYWAQYEETRAVTAVNSAYDGYLKSNGQQLGIKSYGACVNLLAEWVKVCV
ncbi:MAG: DUF3810 domain-containing protein [Oscillospiraceae bacterium]|jgi:hypothetical protein|nr:DUF3810 domain-containing protein [Oscillospiraceae bacterium]